MSANLNKFLRENVRPVLYASGFAGEDRLFSRERDHYMDLVEFQQFKSDSMKFTMNVGIFIPEIHELIWGGRMAEGLVFCILRRRVGELISPDTHEALDIWWDLRKVSPSGLSLEIAGLMHSVVFPFLARINSHEQLMSEILNSPKSWASQQAFKLNLAALAAKMGDTKTAHEILELMVNSPWSTNAKNLADRLGISLTT